VLEIKLTELVKFEILNLKGRDSMENIKQGIAKLAEVSAELDRLDALLGEKMKGFDENKSESEFRALMKECEDLKDRMEPLYRLEAQLKRG
jgi:hypothetical protein